MLGMSYNILHSSVDVFGKFHLCSVLFEFIQYQIVHNLFVNPSTVGTSKEIVSALTIRTLLVSVSCVSALSCTVYILCLVLSCVFRLYDNLC